MKKFQKKTLIGMVIAVAVVLAVMAIGFAKIGEKFESMETSTRYTKNSYAIGSISTTTGKIVESKQNIYTKDMNKIADATIKLSEDATITYKVFFYDTDKVFISATDSLDEDFDAEDIAEGAVYFRVVITPGLVDGEPVELATSADMQRYTSQISIVVAK